MKTKIPIKQYVLDPEVRKTIEHLAGPNAGTGYVLDNAKTVAKAYLELEAHHREETERLMKTIERFERMVDEMVANAIALNDQFSKG